MSRSRRATGEAQPNVTYTVKINQWNKADWILPHSAHLPVEVAFEDGKTEVRETVTGDWRPVVRWRMIDKREHKAQKKSK